MPSIVNQHFDKVYVLSLNYDTERRSRMETLLSSLDIEFEFYDALNGNSVRYDREWNIYHSRPLATELERKKNRKLITSRGAWGCLRSYISLLRHVLSKGCNKILILEDDIFFSKDFSKDFSQFVKSIDEDWKLLFLGASQGNWSKEKFNSHYYHPTPEWTYGAFALGYDISIIPTILESAMKMMSPYDKDPLSAVMRMYPDKCYVAYPNMVIADVRKSNNREERDIIQHAEKMKWDLSHFELL
jgi:GR25 family glycosyltransferase involved in LPS biosynthesis